MAPKLPGDSPTRITQLLQSLLTCVGWALLITLTLLILSYRLESNKSPFPFAYGEGIMAWGTQEISEGRWPYGEIEESPSRYSCYGPATYTLTALLSKFLSPENPLRFIEAGRLLTLISWGIGAVALGIACRNQLLGVGTVALTVLTPITTTLFFWAFRIDGTLFACQSLLLLTLLRAEGKPLWIGTITLLSTLALIKPTSAIDLLPITLCAIALRQEGDTLKNLKSLAAPIAIGCVVAPLLFFALDAVTGLKMTKNILLDQTASGISEEISFLYNTELWVKRETLPLLLACCAGIASLATNHTKRRNAGLLVLAIATSCLFAALTCLKDGSDQNYLIPSLIPLSIVTSSLLQKNPSLSPILLLSLTPFLAVKPLTLKEWEPYLSSPTCHQMFLEIKEAHDKDNFLSEEVFYSVAAGRQPLITDIFQTTQYYLRESTPPTHLIERASGAWGGERICDLLRAQPKNLSDTLHLSIKTPTGPQLFPTKALSPPRGPWQDTFQITLTKELIQAVNTPSNWKKNPYGIPATSSFLIFTAPTLSTLFLLAFWLLAHPSKIRRP